MKHIRISELLKSGLKRPCALMFGYFDESHEAERLNKFIEYSELTLIEDSFLFNGNYDLITG